MDAALDALVRRVIARALPGAEVTSLELLGPDDRTEGATAKGGGYGVPVRARVVEGGRARSVVFHTASANAFGHDRRADRAAEMVLAYDTFGLVPRHTAALDVGAVSPEGPVSLRDAGEFYLLTTWAEGEMYADRLRRAAERGAALPGDLDDARGLGRYLARLHAARPDGDDHPSRYRRVVRDLVGSGEGIYGLVDGYPDGTPEAPAARLRDLEQRCAAYRWTLRAYEHRLARVHGDFHPFNLVLDVDGALTVLDTSRGSEGDPADDVACLAVNFPFFALEHPGTWGAFRALLHAFVDAYREGRDDDDLWRVAPPWFAWRALVVCNPRFYPTLRPATRDRMLTLAARCLDAGRLDPARFDEAFA